MSGSESVVVLVSSLNRLQGRYTCPELARVEGDERLGRSSLMTALAAAPPKPAYVPAGYRLQAELVGQIFMGFHGEADQVRLTYTKGLRDRDFSRPLFVYISPPTNSPVLAGTEEKPGQPLDLAVAETRGVYHDGQWELGRGYDERYTGSVFVNWDFRDVHSISVVHPQVLFAARGSRENGIGVDELVTIAASFPYAATRS